MQKANEKETERPPQSQTRQPGSEALMDPHPQFYNPLHKGTGKLEGKVAIVTGGDSGIGRAVAVLFAIEGARVLISYLDEEEDARYTKEFIREHTGKEVVLFPGDVGKEQTCHKAVEIAMKSFGQLDILVNNAAEHHPAGSIEEITERQLEQVFRTNVFSYFFMCKSAMTFMQKGGSIINTTSVTAYRGSSHLLDYAATKGAIVSFTRSLSAALAPKGIRVNGVAPGPIWTPLIPASFDKKHVATFGSDVPLGRAGQPVEVAPAYLYLACNDSSYMTGQILHPNGGEIVNG
jgi:NAD(P)-dependent dehydrogenase (short-subunit alcohol dehydrogenase family)